MVRNNNDDNYNNNNDSNNDSSSRSRQHQQPLTGSVKLFLQHHMARQDLQLENKSGEQP
jgi:hypothetical protein